MPAGGGGQGPRRADAGNVSGECRVRLDHTDHLPTPARPRPTRCRTPASTTSPPAARRAATATGRSVADQARPAARPATSSRASSSAASAVRGGAASRPQAELRRPRVPVQPRRPRRDRRDRGARSRPRSCRAPGPGASEHHTVARPEPKGRTSAMTTPILGSGESSGRRVPVDEAVALVQPGSRVYLGSACAAPRTLLAALEAARPGPAHRCGHAPGLAPRRARLRQPRRLRGSGARRARRRAPGDRRGQPGDAAHPRRELRPRGSPPSSRTARRSRSASAACQTRRCAASPTAATSASTAMSSQTPSWIWSRPAS